MVWSDFSKDINVGPVPVQADGSNSGRGSRWGWPPWPPCSPRVGLTCLTAGRRRGSSSPPNPWLERAWPLQDWVFLKLIFIRRYLTWIGTLHLLVHQGFWLHRTLGYFKFNSLNQFSFRHPSTPWAHTPKKEGNSLHWILNGKPGLFLMRWFGSDTHVRMYYSHSLFSCSFVFYRGPQVIVFCLMELTGQLPFTSFSATFKSDWLICDVRRLRSVVDSKQS